MFEILVTVVTVFYVIIALMMILIILLQAGKGGMGSALGGGASQSVFGGGGSADILAKITQMCAASFMIFAMFLAYAGAHSGSSTLKAKSEQNTEEERLAGASDEVNYEMIGRAPLRLPAPGARPAANASTNLDNPPQDPAEGRPEAELPLEEDNNGNGEANNDEAAPVDAPTDNDAAAPADNDAAAPAPGAADAPAAPVVPAPSP